MRHELLSLYAVAWVFGGVGLLVSFAYLGTKAVLRRRGKTITDVWNGVYIGFAVTLFPCILLCLIAARQTGWPHY